MDLTFATLRPNAVPRFGFCAGCGQNVRFSVILGSLSCLGCPGLFWAIVGCSGCVCVCLCVCVCACVCVSAQSWPRLGPAHSWPHTHRQVRTPKDKSSVCVCVGVGPVLAQTGPGPVLAQTPGFLKQGHSLDHVLHTAANLLNVCVNGMPACM